MKQVVILGDSWGAGVWGPRTTPARLTPISPGFEQFFQQRGHKVINLSKPGSSNREQINKLKDYCKTGNTKDTVFLMVQTDPFRSIKPYDKFSELIIQCKGLLSAMSYVRKMDYNLLQNVCEEYKIQTHLIGGLSAVVPEEINNTKILIPLVLSWPGLLLKDLPEYKNINWNKFSLWGSEWTIKSISLSDLMNTGKMNGIFANLAEQVIEELHELDKNNIIFNHSYFAPDYAHPNLEAHKILFDYIVDGLKE